MKVSYIFALCVLATVGCGWTSNSNTAAREESAEKSNRPEITLDSKPLLTRVTNQFGMTFRLVTIDTARADHKGSFPTRSYYLQETKLTEEQHTAFRKAAFGDGTYESINWYYNSGRPSEWREWLRYAEALSKFDTEYDYSLPSRSQWMFACMNGYHQSCDKTKSSVYGTVGMPDTNGFAEPIDELFVRNGYEFGVLMGYWKNNWGEHDGTSKPDCPCEYWTVCNPDADDSLNEIIDGRFVLLPKGSIQTIRNGGG